MDPRSSSAGLCSETSSVLRGSQTPCVRASVDFALRLPTATRSAIATGSHRVSRFSCMTLPHMLGVSSSTAPGPSAPRLSGADGLAFDSGNSLGTWMPIRFRGSIPGLRVPLSTLRARPCGRVRMTRGHRGWLTLQCANSSFATSCRLIPALLPGRIARSRWPPPHVTRRATSRDRHGNTMEANAASSARMGTVAPSAPSSSSITSGPTRWEVRRPPTTSPFAAGATINTRQSGSSVLAAGTWTAIPEIGKARLAPGTD